MQKTEIFQGHHLIQCYGVAITCDSYKKQIEIIGDEHKRNALKNPR